MSAENTELKRLEEELQRSRDQVFHLAKLAEMGKLVAVVVHELSQPLLGIKAFAQILHRKCNGDDFVEPKIKMIEEQAVHMETLLDTLRQYSQSPRPLQRNLVDPLVPVKSALELFHERGKKLRVKIRFQAEENLPIVRGNRGHLQQVVSNLLNNALDELEAERDGEGEIQVRLAAVESGVRVLIADSGQGMSAEAKGHLFEAFFTTKGTDKGTGLGLSICKDILKQYGGSIRLLEAEEVNEIFGANFGAAFEVMLAREKAD